MNTPRVKEILSWYGSDNPGTLNNLGPVAQSRQIGRDRAGWSSCQWTRGSSTGRARSFAVNPRVTIRAITFNWPSTAGCNAYAAPLGFIEAGARDFAGEIPLILKINNHDVLADEKDPLSALTSGGA